MNCKCGQDLTNVKITTGTSKTTGKPWSAKFCPSCKEANWVKQEQPKKTFAFGESSSKQEQGHDFSLITAIKELTLAIEELTVTVNKKKVDDLGWDNEEENIK